MSTHIAPLHPRVRDVTERVRERSAHARADYLARVEAAAAQGTREGLSCTNLHSGVLEARVPDEVWERRDVPTPDLSAYAVGTGRELFAAFRAAATGAEEGAVACMP